MSSSIPRTSGIYKITCIPTGKVYIGSAVNLAARWPSHCHHLLRGTHHNAHLQSAWNKYGADRFRFDVIELCNLSDLVGREQYHIDQTRCYERTYGFNSRRIAESNVGAVFSEEASARLSSFRQGKARGPMPQHQRDAIASAKRGTKYRPHSEEARQQKSQRQQGRSLLQTVKDKIGAALKGRSAHPATERAKVEANSRDWLVVDPDGNEYQVRNLELFCREHGLIATSMGAVASGKQRQHKGWKCYRLQ